MIDDLIIEQIAYYDARAPEYEDAYERRGNFDRGAKHNQQWKSELKTVERALLELDIKGNVLELACGSGHWTRLLALKADHVTAVDASLRMLDLARAGTWGLPVDFIQAGLFVWEAPQRFDMLFFAFWLSHIPPPRFADFWGLVRRNLIPGGRVFFVDGPFTQPSENPRTTIEDISLESRRTADGREFRAVKVLHNPNELVSTLRGLGWAAQVATTERFFFYGRAH